MRKKIEKLEDIITDRGHLVAGIEPVSNQQLQEKINEIIDILNSVMFRPTLIIPATNTQPQTEEEDWIKYVDDKYGEWKKHKIEGDKEAEIQLERFKYKGQDTPEEWGWKKEIWELSFKDGQMLEKKKEGETYTGEYRWKIIKRVQQLLDEREREAEKNLLKRFYNVTSKEEFRDVLDKLNNKK